MPIVTPRLGQPIERPIHMFAGLNLSIQNEGICEQAAPLMAGGVILLKYFYS